MSVRNNQSKQKIKKTENHNPADEGLPHPFRYGDIRDHEESFIRKQETQEGRGEDNEDDTDPDEASDKLTE